MKKAPDPRDGMESTDVASFTYKHWFQVKHINWSFPVTSVGSGVPQSAFPPLVLHESFCET